MFHPENSYFMYNKQQQINSFKMLINVASGKSWKNNSEFIGFYQMQNYVRETSAKIVSKAQQQGLLDQEWEPVWGPVAYSTNMEASEVHADNTMAMYYHKTQNLLVIAIAGTNVNSPYGWFVEDFAVHTILSWNNITGKGAGKIAKGTSLGLDILVNKMHDIYSEGFNNPRLIDVLSAYLRQNPTIEIAVTGHSLGGALSSALALYLSDTRVEWNADVATKISTYPSAGPTIGDQKFAEYYQSQPVEYNALNNSLDMIPRAWNKTTLDTIPTLYAPQIPATAAVNFFVRVAQYQALAVNFLGIPYKNPYQITNPQETKVVEGTFHYLEQELINDCVERVCIAQEIDRNDLANFSNVKDTVHFMLQAGYQHTTAYAKPEMLNIEDFLEIYTAVKKEEKAPYIREIEHLAKNSTLDVEAFDTMEEEELILE